MAALTGDWCEAIFVVNNSHRALSDQAVNWGAKYWYFREKNVDKTPSLTTQRVVVLPNKRLLKELKFSSSNVSLLRPTAGKASEGFTLYDPRSPRLIARIHQAARLYTAIKGDSAVSLTILADLRTQELRSCSSWAVTNSFLSQEQRSAVFTFNTICLLMFGYQPCSLYSLESINLVNIQSNICPT